MIWMALLGAAIILRQDQHIRVKYFFNLLPNKIATFVQIIFRLLVIIYLIVLCKEGVTTAISMQITKSPSLGISMFLPYLAIPVTSVLMLFFAVNNLLDDISRIINQVKNHSTNPT
jgi:C4-dicarboxylate transporter DctM subunit